MLALFIIGRILLGGFFIYSGVNHFAKLNGMTGYAKAKRLPFPALAVGLSGLMLLVGGLMILFNFHIIIGFWILVIFMVFATLTMHQFWMEKDPAHRQAESIGFLKNIALIGALLMMIAR